MSSVLRLTTNLFKILSDVNLINVILNLKDGEQSFQELQKQLDISQSNLSHLMKKLIDVNIVQYRKDKRKKYYKIKNLKIFTILNDAKSLLTDIQEETMEEFRDFKLYDI